MRTGCCVDRGVNRGVNKLGMSTLERGVLKAGNRGVNKPVIKGVHMFG